jgi:hypothetical protein
VFKSDNFETVLSRLCDKYRILIVEYYLMEEKKFWPYMRILLNAGKLRFERSETPFLKRRRSRIYALSCPKMLTIEDMFLSINLQTLLKEHEEILREKSGELDGTTFIMLPTKSHGMSIVNGMFDGRRSFFF